MPQNKFIKTNVLKFAYENEFSMIIFNSLMIKQNYFFATIKHQVSHKIWGKKFWNRITNKNFRPQNIF